MAKVKIPKQIFVVSQNRPEFEYPNPDDWKIKIETPHNFGFLHPHEPHLKPDVARKQTQMSWAYNGTPYQLGDQWWIKGNDREFDHVARTWIFHPFDHPMDPTYAPRVWDNVPLAGFVLIDTVNRYRGNKLFKVLDPRGVEFEITVASLFEILMNGVVDKGVILSPCLWKANKNLVVA